MATRHPQFTMKTFHLAAATLLAAAMTPALAAVTADEAKQLGTTLTRFGAIKAGNKEGTIPEYTGTPVKPPADFKPGSGFYPDPFNDKPLYRIDAKNVDQHADKLIEGQKRLIKSNPGYYIDVYPTHRTEIFPEKVLAATQRNATTCKLLKDYMAVDPACRGGLPFPIPKSGYEVMWNMATRWQGDGTIVSPGQYGWLVDGNGKPTMTSEQYTLQEKPYYQLDQSDRDPQMLMRTFSITRAPSRSSGVGTGIIDYLDTDQKPRRSWSYTPGQRRVRLAPEFAYDTPVASLGGATLFDELWLFSGKMDRFDFKLIGKKEMIAPYNNNALMFTCKPADKLQPKHINPACERWELHRMWVVEATLKPGQRHVYSKRVYYIDEDGYGSGMFDAFDHDGALYRSMFNLNVLLYDAGFVYAGSSVVYDFNRGNYLMVADQSAAGIKPNEPRLSERDMGADATMVRESVR
tara:strand:- start:789 stop:2177 length:1389 start_codon:yes stop_codon:yes gene_type:complete